MAVLQPSEYDASYFDGRFQAMRHNAGYSTYKRWNRNNSEHWKDIAASLNNTHALAGKKVLEIGSAKGFVGRPRSSTVLDCG
jgi:tRNA G46 methylase TrmB